MTDKKKVKKRVVKKSKSKATNHNENNIKIVINGDKGTKKRRRVTTKKGGFISPNFSGQGRVISSSQPYTPLEALQNEHYSKTYLIIVLH